MNWFSAADDGMEALFARLGFGPAAAVLAKKVDSIDELRELTAVTEFLFRWLRWTT